AGLLTFAGLWEAWRPEPDAEPVHTYTILTTGPSEFMRSIHDRMPVILDGEARQAWLDHSTSIEDLRALLRAAAEDRLVAHPISVRVNNPRYDAPDLLDPVEA